MSRRITWLWPLVWHPIQARNGATGVARSGFFWSANPLGDSLFFTLDKLVKCGVLLKNEDGDKYKWNPAFEWEKHNPK